MSGDRVLRRACWSDSFFCTSPLHILAAYFNHHQQDRLQAGHAAAVYCCCCTAFECWWCVTTCGLLLLQLQLLCPCEPCTDCCCCWSTDCCCGWAGRCCVGCSNDPAGAAPGGLPLVAWRRPRVSVLHGESYLWQLLFLSLLASCKQISHIGQILDKRYVLYIFALRDVARVAFWGTELVQNDELSELVRGIHGVHLYGIGQLHIFHSVTSLYSHLW
jgi:hypothetical protein